MRPSTRGSGRASGASAMLETVSRISNSRLVRAERFLQSRPKPVNWPMEPAMVNVKIKTMNNCPAVQAARQHLMPAEPENGHDGAEREERHKGAKQRRKAGCASSPARRPLDVGRGKRPILVAFARRRLHHAPRRRWTLPAPS